MMIIINDNDYFYLFSLKVKLRKEEEEGEEQQQNKNNTFFLFFNQVKKIFVLFGFRNKKFLFFIIENKCKCSK